MMGKDQMQFNLRLKKKFKDRKDKDIDNDGDTDDSDEYLHKKRQAITKAIKKESSLGGVVGIPALGDFVKGK